jgi:hypothetical protein
MHAEYVSVLFHLLAERDYGALSIEQMLLLDVFDPRRPGTVERIRANPELIDGAVRAILRPDRVARVPEMTASALQAAYGAQALAADEGLTDAGVGGVAPSASAGAPERLRELLKKDGWIIRDGLNGPEIKAPAGGVYPLELRGHALREYMIERNAQWSTKSLDEICV